MASQFGPVLGDDAKRAGSPKKKILIGVVAVAAVAAVAVGAVMVTGKSSNATSASESSGTSGGSSKSAGGTSRSSNSVGFSNSSATTESGTVKPAGNASAATKAPAPTTDPTKATFSLHALAIGDWGVSPGGDSCCSKYEKEDGESLYRDQQAQDQVAYLLSLSAADLKPKCVISHGDNFYWNGVGKGDQANRFADTFEAKYKHESLIDVPWLNVMGNHDYGGAAFICGDADNEWTECTSQKEMLAALDARFDAQASYKSPNGDRWKLPSHYYKETIKDAASGITVDIFNVDTNDATVHGAEQVCCQCYGYLGPKKKTDPDYVNCNTVHRGHKLCFGGDNAMFAACAAKFKAWTDDSLNQLLADTQASTADWKIVNSHYSPHYHMDPTMMKVWFDALEKGGVQLFINGHTHAESHDIADFNTHFITNGAGGGIQSEAIGAPPPYVTNVKSVWSGKNSPYGFFELSFSKDWLRTRFITFDSKWKFAEDATATIRGGKEVGHCWYIPKDGSAGKECQA